MSKVNVRGIKNAHARSTIEQAINYKSQIDALADQQLDAIKKILMPQIAEISGWLAAMFQLAEQIDTYEANAIISHDRKQLPNELQKLKTQLDTETNRERKASLQDAYTTRQKLQDSMQAIDLNIEALHSQLDGLLEHMVKIHSLLQSLDVKQKRPGK